MKIALIIIGIWILAVAFYLALFRAAAKGDRILNDIHNNLNDEGDEI